MNELYAQTPYLDEITKHVERWIGPVETVLHEIVSVGIHLDVLMVKPNEDRPYFTLIAAGMSALRMNTPPERAMFALSELIMVLPATNRYLLREGVPESDNDESSEPIDYYPIRDLKSYARYPHESETWIGPGHTLATAKAPPPLGADTSMTAYLVHFPFAIQSREGWKFSAKDGETVSFMQLYAIHTDELEFSFENDGDALIDKLNDAGVLDCYDPTRPSTIKRKKRFGIL